MSILAATVRSEVRAFAAEVRVRANALYETSQYKRLYSIPLTRERARMRSLQFALWTHNRRDCWAFAQALAPFDVKQLIWQHEEDELAGNKARGVADHFEMQIEQGKVLGLTADDFHNVRMAPGTRTCAYAWIHLAKDSHWLKSVGACCALEIMNSAEWVDGGGGAYRVGKMMERDLGIPMKKQSFFEEHVEVDVEHAHMLIQVADRYGTTREALVLMLEGIAESWEIQQIWTGILADMMEALPDR